MEKMMIVEIESVGKNDLKPIKSERYTLKSSKTVYHGSPFDKAEKIISDGFLRSFGSHGVDKLSGGTLEEEGLIWLFVEKNLAEFYARGTYRYQKDEEEAIKGGSVFTVTLAAGTKIIDRYAELTSEEAEILNEVNMRRSYDSIKRGIKLSSAMYKLYQHPGSTRTYGEILPLLGYNGIHYGNGNQIGIAAKSIKFDSYENLI
jgi:hypothetical protein